MKNLPLLPNEIVGYLSMVGNVSLLVYGYTYGYSFLILFIQFGFLVLQQVMLSFWGIETFNNWFKNNTNE